MWDYPDYEDFYREPSEFEMQIMEFGNTLKESVSREWVDRMNALEHENAELQEIKKNFESIKADFEKKKSECESKADQAFRNAEYDARRARLKDLMKDVQTIFWDIETSYKYGVKCNKCNENRLISYKTPSGKDAFEDCECAKRIEILQPRMQVLYELALGGRNNTSINAWFREYHSGDDDSYIYSDYFGEKIVVEEDADITQLNLKNSRKFYFRTYEKCQEFCDWYNTTVKNINIKDLSDDRSNPVRNGRSVSQ